MSGSGRQGGFTPGGEGKGKKTTCRSAPNGGIPGKTKWPSLCFNHLLRLLEFSPPPSLLRRSLTSQLKESVGPMRNVNATEIRPSSGCGALAADRSSHGPVQPWDGTIWVSSRANQVVRASEPPKKPPDRPPEGGQKVTHRRPQLHFCPPPSLQWSRSPSFFFFSLTSVFLTSRL